MEMVKATVTQVSPLTVTIEGATRAAPGVLISGTPTVGVTCYLAFLTGGNQPPLVFVPGAT